MGAVSAVAHYERPGKTEGENVCLPSGSSVAAKVRRRHFDELAFSLNVVPWTRPLIAAAIRTSDRYPDQVHPNAKLVNLTRIKSSRRTGRRLHSIRLDRKSQPLSPFFRQQKTLGTVAARAEQLQVVGPVRTALKERDDVVDVPGLFSRLVKRGVARGAPAILGIPKSLDILGGMRARRPY
jgi:hypothetical protein